MPGYVLVLMAMLLAGLWFDRPTARRVMLVGVLFTLGWLVEWRLIFPTLPALVLALALADLPFKRRAGLIALLLVAVVATAGIVQQAWEGHAGAVGLHDLLWTGKGVDSGWGGLGWSKLWMMLAGVGGYLVTLGTLATPVEAQRLAAAARDVGARPSSPSWRLHRRLLEGIGPICGCARLRWCSSAPWARGRC
jgi:hypothetical protein